LEFRRQWLVWGLLVSGYFSLFASGTILLFLGLGLLDVERFALGNNSGIRVLATLAISGCLLCALGHALIEAKKCK